MTKLLCYFMSRPVLRVVDTDTAEVTALRTPADSGGAVDQIEAWGDRCQFSQSTRVVTFPNDFRGDWIDFGHLWGGVPAIDDPFRWFTSRNKSVAVKLDPNGEIATTFPLPCPGRIECEFSEGLLFSAHDVSLRRVLSPIDGSDLGPGASFPHWETDEFGELMSADRHKKVVRWHDLDGNLLVEVGDIPTLAPVWLGRRSPTGSHFAALARGSGVPDADGKNHVASERLVVIDLQDQSWTAPVESRWLGYVVWSRDGSNIYLSNLDDLLATSAADPAPEPAIPRRRAKASPLLELPNSLDLATVEIRRRPRKLNLDQQVQGQM